MAITDLLFDSETSFCCIQAIMLWSPADSHGTFWFCVFCFCRSISRHVLFAAANIQRFDTSVWQNTLVLSVASYQKEHHAQSFRFSTQTF